MNCLLRLNRLLAALPLLAGILVTFSKPAGALAQTTTLLDMDTSVWRLHDSNINLGTAWKEVNYPEEASWRTGIGLFGVEPTVPYPYPSPIRTPVVYGGYRVTHYFRTHFTLNENPANVVVEGTAYVDDGAVFYVNGVEIGRIRIPHNPVHHTNRAQLASPEGQPVSISVPPAALVTGDNVFAVELHQNAPTSADVVFGLGLQATVVEYPSIVNTNEPADRTVHQGASTVLAVEGRGIPPPAYFWYRNGALLANVTNSSYSINNMGAGDAGSYYVVLSNRVGVVTSRLAQVDYIPDTNAPGVLYALGDPNLTQIKVVFTEAPVTDEAQDRFNWEIRTVGGAVVLNPDDATLTQGTNLSLFSFQARDPAERYELHIVGPLGDPFGNVIPLGTVIPVATFDVPTIRATNSWRFEQSGTDLGTMWRSNSFDDGTWTNGVGPFDAFRPFDGAEPPLCRTDIQLPDFSLLPVGACISLSNANNSAQLSTTYFRTHFNYTGDTTNSVLRLEVLVDDGAVFYLNGKQIGRLGMPDGPILNGTLASRFIFNPGWETLEQDADCLLQGDNVLAVELHQDSLGSPDWTFFAHLTVVTPTPPAP